MSRSTAGTERHLPQGRGTGKLTAALAWASRGLKVFPLQANSKLPFEMGWTLSATTDPEVIRAWWTDPLTGAERDHNVGFLTSHHVVLDVDVKAGKPGLDTFLVRLGMSFDTLVTRTPTGGFHCYCQGIGREVGQSPIGPGVDVRSHHGYVVAPGSTIDGVAYELKIDLPVAEFPVELRPLLKSPRYRRVDGVSIELDLPESVEIAANWLRREAPPAVQGMNGDDRTFRVAAKVRDFGVSEDLALDLMLDEYNERCEPPWSAGELRVKVENAYRYAKGEAGSASPEAAFGDVVHVPPPERTRRPTSDTLAGLVDKTAADAGAPFQPEILEALADLQQTDCAAFEVLRAQLKKARCRVSKLDEALAARVDAPSGSGPKQADILIELALTAELFHSSDSTGFADLDVDGHRETWKIRGLGFRRWLTRRYYEKTGGAPSSEALQSALAPPPSRQGTALRSTPADCSHATPSRQQWPRGSGWRSQQAELLRHSSLRRCSIVPVLFLARRDDPHHVVR